MNVNKFLYQQPEAFTSDDDGIVGSKYNSDAIVLSWEWLDDDVIRLLMVEADDESGEPFVITHVHIDALDVRNDVARLDTIRYALIEWEA